MPGQSEALVAVLLPRPDAADAIRTAWDAGEAVAVLDPDAPAAVTSRLLDMLAPTDVHDGDGRRRFASGRPVPRGTAAVVATSGTTGDAKGVELTTAGLEAIGTAFAAACMTGPDDRALICLPLHHVAGLAVLARARVSSTPVDVHAGFDVEAVATAPRALGSTLVSLVPTMLQRLLDAEAPLDRYRQIIVGGAPTPPALRARAERTGAPVVDAYGMSETWGGFVLDGVPIQGADVTVGDNGEILVRGPMVMRGYRLRDADAAAVLTTAAFTGDGRLHTGDIGAIDPEGRVRVLDRARDIVITGGVNVAPTAVEAVLIEHPMVVDVCVAGTPDDEWGERVVAFVVPRAGSRAPTLDEIRAFARDQLTAAQLPRELVLLDVIPRTPGGKAQRHQLRARP
jgi:O-succinylbenzoic acid--CoA ligase